MPEVKNNKGLYGYVSVLDYGLSVEIFNLRNKNNICAEPVNKCNINVHCAVNWYQGLK